MSDNVLVCRSKTKIAFWKYANCVATSIFLSVVGLYGLYLHGWRMFFAVFPFAVLFGIFAYFSGAERSRLKRSSLEIDAQNGLLTFRHFRFVASFFPEKPRVEEVVRFDQILGVRRVEVQKGNYWWQKGISGLRVRTDKGAVTISEEMEHFDVIATTLSELVAANESREDEYRKKIEAEPKIRTPWYVWLILIGAASALVIVGWKWMFPY